MNPPLVETKIFQLGIRGLKYVSWKWGDEGSDAAYKKRRALQRVSTLVLGF